MNEHVSLAAGVGGLAIKRVAVIGAGSMGGGIAAQFANAGLQVDLLDMAGPEAERSKRALDGVARQLKAGGFMDEALSTLVRPGNVDDHIDRLADADWIIEAIIEDLSAKHALYRRIDAIRKPGAVVSSNTSTIPRAALVEGMSDAFAADFVITHFFNPPRQMQLVELVTAAENSAASIADIRTALETVLGKTVIDCRDTPGFIANRIGCHWLALAALEAFRRGLTSEQADAVMAAFGVPRTGVFGLLDLIGIDLGPHVWGSLMRALPDSDDLQAHDLPGDATIRALIAAGRLGRKTKAGFYRMTADKRLETYDPSIGNYRPAQPGAPADLPGGGRDLVALLAGDGPHSAYAWSVLSGVITYAAACAPEIAHDASSIDTAMKLGYAWREGPFELARRIGMTQLTERLQAEGRTIPAALGTMAAGAPSTASTGGVPDPLSAAKAAGRKLLGNEAASLWLLEGGVACFELHTKMNTFAPAAFDMLEQTLERGGHDFRALVLGNNDARAFSAGADLGFILGMLKAGESEVLGQYVAGGQKLFLALKYAPFPVVAAAHGFALGGGCEFLLHADAVVAHAELTAGLPEPKVGLVPAWGGCTQLLIRSQKAGDGPRGPVARVMRAFSAILPGNVSGSARQAARTGLLRDGDVIVMNRSQLLEVAMRMAAGLADAGYRPPEKAVITVRGASAKAGMMSGVQAQRAAGLITDTDLTIADALAGVLSGGPDGNLMRPITEEDMMQLEREALLDLGRDRATMDRIEHMMKTGKPLRN